MATDSTTFSPPAAIANDQPAAEQPLRPLEQEVLDEYAQLVKNLDDVNALPLPSICSFRNDRQVENTYWEDFWF